jgi:arylsulfatase A-like enzyme
MKLTRILSLFCLLTLGCVFSLVAAETPPNILIILSDDQSYPHVGCYGDPNANTPYLDKFASEGMTFTRAYVTTPQCVPSRASIMTGRSPIRINMTRFSAALPADVKSFPEYLREEKGYYIGVAGRSYHLDGSGNRGEIIREIHDQHNLRNFADRMDYAKVAQGEKGNAFNDSVFRQFTEFLDQVPQGKPFFLQLCYSEPHRPFDGRDIPNPTDPAKLVLPKWFPDTPEVRQDLAGYYDLVSRLDTQFGRVMAELEKRSLKENTLVLFSADNGAALLRGKGTLYNTGIHVPLIVRWPGKIAAGSKSDELISGEDFGPTCLAAAGIATPADWTGQSFLPILRGERNPPVREYIFAQRGPHAAGLPGQTPAFDLSRTIVGKRYKLIYNAMFHLPYRPVDFAGLPAWRSTEAAAQQGRVHASLVPLYTGLPRPMFELYDLQSDPDELNNLAGKREAAAIERGLRIALSEWMILERDFIPLPIPRD